MGLPTKANTPRPLAAGYGALIEYGDTPAESLYLALAVSPSSPLQLQSVRPEERGPDLASNPEDMRSESGQSFSRSVFSGGEGLDRAHKRDGTDRDWSRFWDSRNVDVSPAGAGEAEEVKLLHSTSSLRAMAAGADRGALVRIGTVLYGIISSATLVDRTADPTAAAPAWTTEDPGGIGDITDLAALGDELYAAQATSGGIRKRDAAGTWTAWSDLTGVVRLWGAKARIIASTGNALYEARSGAGSVLIHTLPSGESWNDVVDAGGAMLAAGSDGEIYTFVEENAELTLKGQTNLEGEEPTALGFAQGLLFIGTAEPTTAGGQIGRLWRALFVGLRIREGQVLREWGDGATSIDRAPRRIIASRESVYTAVVEDGSETHLWRYYLETGGLSRDLILGASGVVHGLAVVDERMFASVFGDALWREDTLYASEGWLIGPAADFYSAAPKAWVGARASLGTVPVDTDVFLDYSTDPAALEDEAHASWIEVGAFDENSSQSPTEIAITEVESRYIAGKVRLTPNAGRTATPALLAFAFRGLADITEDDYLIPVNLSDRLEVPGRKPLHSKGRGEEVRRKLAELKGQAATVTLLRLPEVIKGQLRGFAAQVPGIPRKGSVTVTGDLLVRGQRQ